MKYGNRGMNQPCIDLRTTKCVITAQNHGYAVADEKLPEGWKTFFMNANDHSNEGIIHSTKPFFSGEFDYSGSQALKALKEEGIFTILLNPNIATVQTQPNTKNSDSLADKVYFLPVTQQFVMDVIRKEKPDSILISMGGQTALNVGIELYKSGFLKTHGVRVLGTPIETILDTEDREKFSAILAELGESTARSLAANNIDEAKEAARTISYPVLVRSAFALGGLGSGFVNNEEELVQLCNKTFLGSTGVAAQVLIDEDLRGWKEVEYEVVRDCKDNCITVCNMENFDPLGVHTGDSIVIAPSLTLSNSDYFMLRKASLRIIRHLGIVGECNIQFALDPKSSRYCVIEVNARLSRSSALASKATGYPLAYVAAKLCLGKDLVLLKNHVTKSTSACFEPSLDYVVCKIPRWDLKKFNFVSDKLDSSMKSVGEAMAIGKTFEEVIQKGLRMVSQDGIGFSAHGFPSLESEEASELESLLTVPTPLRVFAIAKALSKGYTVQKIHELTKIDVFFLEKLSGIYKAEALVNPTMTLEDLREVKKLGFSDLYISKLLGGDKRESDVRKLRVDNKIMPVVKQIDTLAAEFPAETNYLYTTYWGSESDIDYLKNLNSTPAVVVLGNGSYSIGSSVEFDWCAVSCLRTLRKNDIPSVMINFNPETVSTDYDESDRLYFEELTLERILDIVYVENCGAIVPRSSANIKGVVVSVGGQIANNLVLPLSNAGVPILGTSAESIDRAEDRHKFSNLCDELNIDQPEWIQSTSIERSLEFAHTYGYPVLVRPSYVLSGANMRVLSNDEEMRAFLGSSSNTSEEKVSEAHPVVISNFILNAKEVELDAVSQHGRIVNFAISEHIENAGVHSGDATLVLPAQRLYVRTINQIKRIAGNISRELNINGPFNMQFICRDNEVKVIECNLRASRTFPFVSKTFDVNFIELATEIMLNEHRVIESKAIKLLDLDYCGIKAPMFSFTRLIGADPTLGVDMASTGEVGCFAETQHEAFLLSLMATGFKLKPKGTYSSPYQGKKGVVLSIGPRKQKQEIVEYVFALAELGYAIFATEGTYEYIQSYFKEEYTGENEGLKWLYRIEKPTKQTQTGLHALDLLSKNFVEFAVIVPDSLNGKDITDGYKMRRAAVDFHLPLITNLQCAIELVKALSTVNQVPCLSMEEMYKLGEKSSQWSKPKQNVLQGLRSVNRKRGLSISNPVLMDLVSPVVLDGEDYEMV
eukprot:maker-scaffold_43-augustus-gene-1.115-mRNA-1 protein AED:0.14 eAED:0.14 QI:0/0/0/1/0/0.5/2/0/1216